LKKGGGSRKTKRRSLGDKAEDIALSVRRGLETRLKDKRVDRYAMDIFGHDEWNKIVTTL
jgi:hypothetical protein